MFQKGWNMLKVRERVCNCPPCLSFVSWGHKFAVCSLLISTFYHVLHFLGYTWHFVRSIGNNLMMTKINC